MVLAVGSLARNDRLENESEAAEYVRYAFALLPAVILDNDVVSVQCLLLFCLYFLWRLKPAQAWNFINIASSKIQQIYYSRLHAQPEGSQYTFPEQKELEQRAFWAVYLIEKYIITVAEWLM